MRVANTDSLHPRPSIEQVGDEVDVEAQPNTDGGQYAWRCTRVAPAAGPAAAPQSQQQPGQAAARGRQVRGFLDVLSVLLQVFHDRSVKPWITSSCHDTICEARRLLQPCSLLTRSISGSLQSRT